MELTRDILLRGSAWGSAIDSLSPIFKGLKNRTNYNIFMVALTIGILYDQRIEKPDSSGEEPRNVPRNVLQNNDNGKLDFIFQAAVLSTSTQDFSEDERLELAFGEKADFDKVSFLTEFANYGVTKLVECIGDTPLESMENIKNFIAVTIAGHNLELDALPDDILLFDET